MADESELPPAQDPSEILRSRGFVVLLVFAAVIGVVVSLVGWAFLELVHQLQVSVFTDLPSGLGLDPVPTWWPLPVCAVAGLPVAYAVARTPGGGGHLPAGGLIIIEAAGLGGATLPLILIPGLIAGGIGSLVFIGMTHWTALSTADYTLPPLHLAPVGTPTPGEIGWSILIGVAAALVTYPIRNLGLRTAALVARRELLVIPLAGLAVALAAFAFAQITGESPNAVLFSGQEGLGPLVDHAADLSVGTIVYLVLFKSAAWAISLGSFRGGPVFPALFIGAAGGIALSHLPGLPASIAIAVSIGAMFVAFMRLPLSAIIISGALCASAGAAIAPLIIVGVVAAYLCTLAIEGRLGPAGSSPEPTDPDPGTLRSA